MNIEQIISIILTLIFGAVFGSFATLFAYRLPRNESCFGRYFGPKSRCSNCGTTIITRDLIPVLNWLITKGKCRACKHPVSRVHLFVELTTVLLFLICYYRFGFCEKFFIYALASVSLVVAMASDFTHKIFPDQVLLFILFFVGSDKILQDQTILNMANSGLIGVFFVIALHKLIYNKNKHLFANEQHFFSYSKFVLIASVLLNIENFLFYCLILTITLFAVFKALKPKKPFSFGYVFIIPFICLTIISPL
jgi:prepilin signal peptidase PulO-like enzyme (type II secretory pathway)